MTIQQVKNNIKRIITGHEASIQYFSQGGEDAILKCIFRKKMAVEKSGFYIDIGAYHPSYMSNTYMFYIAGWRGINIDPRPGSMKTFNKIRPKDINLEIGIGEKEETLTYYMINENSTMNSFSKAFLTENGMLKAVTKEVPIRVFPLRDVLEKHADQFSRIDILNIDVEGLDMEIIRSNDWKQFRPSVIVLELRGKGLEDVLTNDATKYLCDLGYTVIAKNVIVTNIASVFFVDKDFDY